jgi:sigma-B regulation protein RsbU (phosphoserine phosphatase)
MWKKIIDLFRGKNGNAPPQLGKRILVIDDNETVQAYIKRILTKYGYEMNSAYNGESGLKMVKEYQPHLVLLDFLMPGITGKEVCQRMKSDPEMRNIPVIFLTGSVKIANVIECYDVGADIYLEKPVDGKILVEQIGISLSDQELRQVNPDETKNY